jgi:hypothetical protein
MTFLLGGKVSHFGSRRRPRPYGRFDVRSGPVFPGVACSDGARIAVSDDGIFGCVVEISVCVYCTVSSGALEINKDSTSAIAFSAASRSDFCRRILSPTGR